MNVLSAFPFRTKSNPSQNLVTTHLVASPNRRDDMPVLKPPPRRTNTDGMPADQADSTTKDRINRRSPRGGDVNPEVEISLVPRILVEVPLGHSRVIEIPLNGVRLIKWF